MDKDAIYEALALLKDMKSIYNHRIETDDLILDGCVPVQVIIDNVIDTIDKAKNKIIELAKQVQEEG